MVRAELVKGCENKARTGSTHRMAERDGAAATVEFFRGDLRGSHRNTALARILQCGEDREHLRRECLVDLDHIGFVRRPSESRNRMNGPQPHALWIAARVSITGQSAERFDAELLRGLLAADQQRHGPIGDLRAIPSRHAAALAVEDRPELGEFLGRRVLADPIVASHRLAGQMNRRDFF